MVRKAVDDPAISLGSFRNKTVFKSLAVFIEMWNNLADIVLGRKGCYTRENGKSTQMKLLGFLAWMYRWKADHDERVGDGKRTEYHFFADSTW